MVVTIIFELIHCVQQLAATEVYGGSVPHPAVEIQKSNIKPSFALDSVWYKLRKM